MGNRLLRRVCGLYGRRGFPVRGMVGGCRRGGLRGWPRRIDPLCDLADGDGDGTCRNGAAGDD